MKRDVATPSPALAPGLPRAPAGELDEVTLERARRGERVACRLFVTTYERAVFAVIGRVLGPHRDRARVEDLAQETFLRALRALPRFRPVGSARVSTWLLTIATRRALTELGRRSPQVVPVIESDLPVRPSGTGRIHAAQALQRAIAELTAEQRAVFVLKDVHGLTETEIAEALDLPASAVKARLHRARGRLRACLSQEDPRDRDP